VSVQTTKLMTAEELLAMPDDGSRRYELVDGELIAMSPAGLKHSEIALFIGSHLLQHVLAHRLGKAYGADAGFIIRRDPDTVLAPDVSFIRQERVPVDEGFFPGPPHLAVEVVSPSDRLREVEAKVRTYLSAGTEMVIVVNPRNQTATVTTPAGETHLTIEDALDGGDVVPGWILPLRELFR
jgi:Uma2 family endonuclease